MTCYRDTVIELAVRVERLEGDVADLRRLREDSARGQGERLGELEKRLAGVEVWRARVVGAAAAAAAFGGFVGRYLL